jgi:hypothetical protein
MTQSGLYRQPLPGLVGSHPLGALAAFGLLRRLSHVGQLGEVRLSWQAPDDDGEWIRALPDHRRPDQLPADYHAVLHIETESSPQHLADVLVEAQRGRAEQPQFTWEYDLKAEPSAYAEKLRAISQKATINSREEADFFAAYASEIARQNNGKVKPSGLHMTAGRALFLRDAHKIGQSLDPDAYPGYRQDADRPHGEPKETFLRALNGPWLYQDGFSSLGWDPDTEALHALSAQAPTDSRPFCERAPVWLALEAFPLFPSFARGRRLRTRGFNEYNSALSWPIWSPPLRLTAMASLLGHSELTAEQPAISKLGSLGIRALYRAACQRDNQGRGTLRHARLMCQY